MNLIQLFSQLLGSSKTQLNAPNLTTDGKLDDAFSKLLTEKGFDKKDIAKITQLLESQKNERKAFVNKAGIEVSIEYPVHLIKKRNAQFDGLKEQIAKLPNAAEIQETRKPFDLPTKNNSVKSPTKVVVPKEDSIHSINAKFQILAENRTKDKQVIAGKAKQTLLVNGKEVLSGKELSSMQEKAAFNSEPNQLLDTKPTKEGLSAKNVKEAISAKNEAGSISILDDAKKSSTKLTAAIAPEQSKISALNSSGVTVNEPLKKAQKNNLEEAGKTAITSNELKSETALETEKGNKAKKAAELQVSDKTFRSTISNDISSTKSTIISSSLNSDKFTPKEEVTVDRKKQKLNATQTKTATNENAQQVKADINLLQQTANTESQAINKKDAAKAENSEASSLLDKIDPKQVSVAPNAVNTQTDLTTQADANKVIRQDIKDFSKNDKSTNTATFKSNAVGKFDSREIQSSPVESPKFSPTSTNIENNEVGIKKNDINQRVDTEKATNTAIPNGKNESSIEVKTITNKHRNDAPSNEKLSQDFQVNRSKIAANTEQQIEGQNQFKATKASDLAQPKVRFVSSQKVASSTEQAEAQASLENKTSTPKQAVPNESKQTQSALDSNKIWGDQRWNLITDDQINSKDAARGNSSSVTIESKATNKELLNDISQKVSVSEEANKPSPINDTVVRKTKLDAKVDLEVKEETKSASKITTAPVKEKLETNLIDDKNLKQSTAPSTNDAKSVQTADTDNQPAVRTKNENKSVLNELNTSKNLEKIVSKPLSGDIKTESRTNTPVPSEYELKITVNDSSASTQVKTENTRNAELNWDTTWTNSGIKTEPNTIKETLNKEIKNQAQAVTHEKVKTLDKRVELDTIPANSESIKNSNSQEKPVSFKSAESTLFNKKDASISKELKSASIETSEIKSTEQSATERNVQKSNQIKVEAQQNIDKKATTTSVEHQETKDDFIKTDTKKNEANKQSSISSSQSQQVDLKQELTQLKNDRQNTANAREVDNRITAQQRRNEADFQQNSQQDQQKNQQFSSQINKSIQTNAKENANPASADFKQQLETANNTDISSTLSMANANRTVKMGKDMDVQKVQETIVNQLRYTESTEWNRQRIVMDDGSSLRFNIRKVGETLQLQLVGPQSELNKMVQLNATDIKAHLEQQLGIKVDLQFTQSDGNDQQSSQRNDSQNLFGSMGGNTNGQNQSNELDRSTSAKNAAGLNNGNGSAAAEQVASDKQNPIDGWVG
jgi:hypothetical protein